MEIYMDVQGKGVLIVGSKRIGGVVAKYLASNGMNIAIGYRNSIKEAEFLKQELNNSAVTVMSTVGKSPSVSIRPISPVFSKRWPTDSVWVPEQ